MSKILHLKLDTIENRQVPDLSGNQYHGTVQGCTIAADDAFGNVMNFHESNDYIQIANYKGVTQNNARTVSAWVKTSQDNATIISWGTDAIGRKWIFRVQNHIGVQGAIRIEVNSGYIVGSTPVNEGEWHHVACTYNTNDGANITDAKLYVDGKLEEVSAEISRTLNTASGNDVKIGTGHSNRYFNGQMGPIRLYDHALSQTDILQVMNEDRGWNNFRQIYPIDFNLYDKDNQNVLYIENASDQQLTLQITNASDQQIQLDDLQATVSNTNYHFALRFRPDTLSPASLGGPDKIHLAPTTAESWEMAPPEKDTAGMDVIYLKSKTPDHTLDPGVVQTLVFENAGADAGQGTRGTRVGLQCTNIQYTNNATPLSAGREIHLDVVNHRGKKDIPLHAGFVGDNAVLNDGSTANSLTIKLTNTALYDPANPDKSRLTFQHDNDETKISRIIIAFDTGDTSEEWALATAAQLDSIVVDNPGGWSVVKNTEAAAPQWELTPAENSIVLPGENAPQNSADNYFDIVIDNIITDHPTGHTHINVRYENIPGYWDGQKALVIEKQPLLFYNKNVGIGTVKPTEKLEVNGSLKTDSLITKNIYSLTAWNQAKKIQASDAQTNDYFGRSIAVNGDWALVGAYGEDTGGSNTGSAYLFRREGSTWVQKQKIQASDAQANDYFGFSIAINGDWALVGAYGEDTGGSKAGSAYLFHREGNTWVQKQKIQASDTQAGDKFGYSVAINGDWALVGAYGEDTGGSNAGSAYLFQMEGSAWVQKQKIQASDAGASDYFGRSVAINGDWALVGAYQEDTGGSNAGSAYLFQMEGSAWVQKQKIQASDAGASDYFGRSVAINGDWVLVGAHGEDTGGSSAGSAYLFHREGNAWVEKQKIQASDAQTSDYFGYSVAINGNWALVGAYGEDTGGSSAGSAYLFHLEGNTWMEKQKIQASDAQASDYFGYSVAINGDWALVGAHGEDTGGSNAGSTYLFQIKTAGQITLDENTGNIGIGTDQPDSKLHVAGGPFSVTPTRQKKEGIFLFPTIHEGTGGGHGGGRIFFSEYNQSNGFSLGYNGGLDDMILNWPTHTFCISNHHNNDEQGNIALAINKLNGNVGIGTSSPQSKLDIEGGVAIGADYSGTHTAPSDGLLVQGKVGIGTGSPSEKLHVAGAITINNYIKHNGDSNTRIGFPANDTIKFRTNGTDRLTINPSGNVGIGTESPVGRLNIVGSGGPGQGIQIDNREIKFRGDGSQHFSIYNNKRPDSLTIETTSGSENMGEDGNVKLAIHQNGNVGIGTSAPTEKLEINGNLKVQGAMGAQNLNASGGYQKLGNFMIQWGRFQNSKNNEQSFNFPTSFKNNCFGMSVNWEIDIQYRISPYGLSKSGFKIHVANAVSNTAYFTWMAIGDCDPG